MNENGTILFAEDDDNDAFFFQTALKKAGVRNPIARVTNGEEALHYLTGDGGYADRSKYPFPCLLITDLKMPRLSGFDLLYQAKAVLESTHLPTVVLSASVSDSDKDRSLQMGANAYFSKPSDLDGLIALATDLKQCWLTKLSLRA